MLENLRYEIRTEFKKTSRRLSTYLFLLFFILFSITISTAIRISPFSAQSIISIDIIPNLIQAKYFITQHSVSQVNFNAWYMKWIYNPKPIGFPILSGEFSLLSGLSLYYVGYFGIIWYILEILLVFMLALKILKNKDLALLSSFLMLTYLTGPSNQGPLYAHYANIDLIMFLIIFISIFYIMSIYKKLVISSLGFAGIMSTHRPGLIFIFIFMLMLFIYSLVLMVRNRNDAKLFFKNRTIPYIVGFIFGWDMSFLYWAHIKIENILLFGYSPFAIRLGAMPKFFLDLLRLIDLQTYIYILIAANLLVIVSLYLFFRKRTHIIEKLRFSTSSPSIFIFLSFLFPIGFLSALIYAGNSAGITFRLSFRYFIELWINFARAAWSSDIVRILKQIFYIWHWNVYAMAFLIPAGLVVIKKLWRNVTLGLLIISVFAILGFLWYSQIVYQYVTVIERLYLYLAPFVYIIVSYGTYSLIKGKKNITKKTVIAYVLFLLILSALLFTAYSISFKEPVYSDKNIELATFPATHISEKYLFTSGEISIYSFYDSLRYRPVTPWWGQIPPQKLINNAKRLGVTYIISNIDPKDMPLSANPQNLNLDRYCWKIYSTNLRSIYLL